MKNKPIIFVLSVILSLNVAAQTYQNTGKGIKTVINAVELEIQFYNPSTVRIVKSPKGWEYTKESLSVIEKPQDVSLKTSQEDGVVSLKSNKMEVRLNLQTGHISYYTLSGKLLLQEKDGVKFTDFNDAGVKTFSVFQPFVLDKDETVYGLGQLQNGKMSQRNQTKKMIQGNTEDFLNFIQSVKGYGLFWDNYSPTTFKDNEEETSFLSEVGDCVDYYFMYGGNADGVVAQMRSLTGQAPMFPLWTYGYWQSRERYKSQNETVGVVRKYRELDVPLDGIIQDWQYWGNNYLWNAMDFLNPEYYNPQKMVDDAHQLNAHIMISIWSSFGPMTKPYRELNEKGLLFNLSTWPQSGSEKWPPRRDYPSGVRVYDAYSPEARDIYWKYMNQNMLSIGMDGWWMDSTEPDHFDWKDDDWNHQTALGSFRKVRNAYPLVTVGGVYDHQRTETSDKRVFILTRSAFAGQQRYGSMVWSGDVQASWKDLKNQIPAGLNFSLCGIPYWNSDIGGFFLGKYPKRLADPDYRELHVRWLQFGTFCPMMRSHGADAPREIYQFGEKGQPVFDAIKKYIKLRYNLLPYIYSTSWDVTKNQSSMMRALMMDFANDKNVWNIDNEYLFGKSILVRPVTEPVQSVEVYLPEGAGWYDFWTNEKLSGGKTIQKQTPIDVMPLYIKAGTILPWGPDVQYATEKKWDNLEIRVYPGADATFTLYEDEFDNYNYEKGAYSTIDFHWNNKKQTLTVSKRKGSFPGMLENRIFTVSLQNGTAKTVQYRGEKVDIKF
ncbi:MAG: glycoside hydrolase family 31 protein [Tannerella sp.]|nr:glycoside hydrolase family 31 protein [Tannerella sp.]